MTKTSSDSDYYYVDVKSSHKNVIFSNKGETQTSDLGINDSYSADNALYDASKVSGLTVHQDHRHFWCYGRHRILSFYRRLVTKKVNTFLFESPDKQSKATYKKVYVSNDDWKSLAKVYATF